ncbi:DNA mismatch repair protein PMS1 [Grifola frondosa]|uniref:DNA mismatch repair protein PMS1 n=1 Tax=Grifola frondosa TaxID=5627 RepID=A0A1C7MDI3_GRIFR|nr:DNA mismatch repair protein PMS1 [Grifola frondosa]
MDGDEADEGDVEEMDVDHSECEGQRSTELTAPTVTAASEPSTGDRPRAEFVRTKDGEDVSLRLDLSRVSASWRQLRERLSDALAELDENKAIEALSRVIEKADFASMEPVGQFNLGFIIARRRKMPPGEGSLEDGSRVMEMDDLFIVDQHAADEKYNFEVLQQTTKIKSQKLFQSQSLELTAADELIATENLEMLRQNGFEIDVLDDAPSGQRLQLLAQPTSKSTVFDMKDLEELLHLMRDRPTGQMVRCSKVRAMFAMRACRSSVMVGMPLARRQMMSCITWAPWNSHGIVHMADLPCGIFPILLDLGGIDDRRKVGEASTGRGSGADEPAVALI